MKMKTVCLGDRRRHLRAQLPSENLTVDHQVRNHVLHSSDLNVAFWNLCGVHLMILHCSISRLSYVFSMPMPVVLRV